MKIKVTNNSSKEIEVAINHWGDEGNTKYIPIESGRHDSWDRSDDRGFVMSVSHGGAQRPYYVQRDSDIVVSDDNVTDHGKVIKPLV